MYVHTARWRGDKKSAKDGMDAWVVVGPCHS